MVFIYSAIGLLIGLPLVGLTIWLGLSPSLYNQKSRLPEPSDNATEPQSTNIWGAGND